LARGLEAFGRAGIEAAATTRVDAAIGLGTPTLLLSELLSAFEPSTWLALDSAIAAAVAVGSARSDPATDTN
jgi:hypothetical protein